VVSNRWFPSSKTCSQCGRVNRQLSLAERVFRCGACGLTADRDRNAAANLAAWAEAADTAGAQAPDRQADGRVTNASGEDGAALRHGDGQPAPEKEEPKPTPSWREPRAPEKGAVWPPTS
jgi:putative transposase